MSLKLLQPCLAPACFAGRRLEKEQQLPTQGRKHNGNAHALRPMAQGKGGTIVREVLSGSQRSKLDRSDDRGFYEIPRLVKHVDDVFLSKVTQLYRVRIPDNAVVLDLMSSWVSHLPPEKKYQRVIGHGMNAAELKRNRQLDSFFVRNLNQDPQGWALEDKSIDSVLCCVSVQYLQQPEKVFAEIHRVLKPGGSCIVTFSNRLFYDKAISAWRDNSGFGRVQLVKQYFLSVEGFTEPEAVTEVDVSKAPPASGIAGLLGKVLKLFEQAQGDPFYAVIAYRGFKPVYE